MHTPARLLTAALLLVASISTGCVQGRGNLWGSAGTGQKPTLGGTVSVPFGGGGR